MTGPKTTGASLAPARRRMTGGSRARVLASLGVAAGLLLLVLANARLVHVAVTSQPGCVSHLKLGQSKPDQAKPGRASANQALPGQAKPGPGSFSAAGSAC
jgi:hypothetical protein